MNDTESAHSSQIGGVKLSELRDTKISVEHLTSQVTAGGPIVGGNLIYNYHYHYQAEVVPPPAPAETPGEPLPANPYRYLNTFRPEHAPYFFGREAFTARLVNAVDSRRLVTVLGASGSGKSSVVFAGLVPALVNCPDESWLFTTFLPGHDPFHNLASALVPLYEISPATKTAQLGPIRDLARDLQERRYPLADVLGLIRREWPDHHLLLIADQFEELYTLCRDTGTRQAFLDILLSVREADRLHLVLTLRADFLGQASLYRPLADALQDTTELLGPMTSEELNRAIEQPATMQGVCFEDKLIQRLLDDVGQEEGSLPLLEFALSELWRYQKRRTLTHAAYDEIGKIKGALSRHADRAYVRLPEAEKIQARRVLVQLVNPGAGTEDTRRRATRRDLEQDWPLVAWLATERLVVTNTPAAGLETVELVHEALIRNWPKLRTWMTEDRDFLTWQLGLRADLDLWESTNCDVTALLQGAPLAIAREKLAKRPNDLTERERAYIEASLARQRLERAEKEAQRQRELTKDERTRLLAIVLCSALLMAGLLWGAYWWSSSCLDFGHCEEIHIPWVNLNLFKANLIERNLSGANLSEVNLRGAMLIGVILTQANLSQADLSQANLSFADLNGANLSRANLSGAILNKADLNWSNLRDAQIDSNTKIDEKWRLVWEIVSQEVKERDLYRKDLSRANLNEANLSGADLSGANLSGTDLSEANLAGAKLSGADLSGAILKGAKIDDNTEFDPKWRLIWKIINEGANRQDLSGKDLSGAYLFEADLRQANLSGAKLNGAFLRKADLSGASLCQVDLGGVDLLGVKFDDNTKWPLGFNSKDVVISLPGRSVEKIVNCEQ